jgi:hypothetical protein
MKVVAAAVVVFCVLVIIIVLLKWLKNEFVIPCDERHKEVLREVRLTWMVVVRPAV